MQVNVQGGTNAGWRTVRAAARDWKCPDCGASVRGYWTACPSCHTKRPEGG